MPYTFLSGSSIDVNLFFDAVSSGFCYLGFARSRPTWGLPALVRVQHRPSLTWPTDVMGYDTPGVEQLFYDLNAPGNPTNDRRRCFILEQDAGQTDYDFTNVNTRRFLQEAVTGIMYLDYMSNGWCQITGMKPDIHQHLDATKSYYVVSWGAMNALTTAAKIPMRNVVETASFSTSVVIAKRASSVDVWTQVDLGDLLYTKNTLGEQVIVGLNTAAGKYIDSADYGKEFGVLDAITMLPIISPMTIIPPSADPDVHYYENGTENYILFRYEHEYIDISGTPQTNTVHLKLSDELNYKTSFAIYHESHAVETSAPVADNNPPALQVTYLKSPNINRSIYDVTSLNQITAADVSFCKEILSEEEKAYFLSQGFTVEEFSYLDASQMASFTVRADALSTDTVIAVNDGFTVAVGDGAEINGTVIKVTAVDYTLGAGTVTLETAPGVPLTTGTTVDAYRYGYWAIVEYAVTSDIDQARNGGMNLVMINKSIPKVAPYYEGIYRQLFISYHPAGSLGTGPAIIPSVWDVNKYHYEIGSLMYLANKQPVYRKYISEADETFKLII